MPRLRPDAIPAPAFYGMAKQSQYAPLGPEWCTLAKNIVVDGQNRLAARNGWTQQNTLISGSPDIVQMHEYLNASGTSELITSTATKIFSGIAGALTEKTGSLVFTTGLWKFINFNGFCLGWVAGETPIQYNGSGNFATIIAASGTLPDGNTALAAFGRVWGLDDDKQTIRYSALLDHTRWATVDGGGLIDMRSVWTKGMDEVVGIVSYGSYLVVFGKRHIVLWTDGAGSDIGLNPTNMYVTQVIENAGLVARDAVALVGEQDVVFWSSNGVRSLARTTQEQPTPVNDITPSNNDFLAAALQDGDLSKVRMAHYALESLVLLSHPDNETTFVFDLKQRLPNGGYRMTVWDLVPKSMTSTSDESFYMGFNGRIGKYTGFVDNTSSYRFEYQSGWVPMVGEDNRRRVLKHLRPMLFSPADRTVSFKWWTDFLYNTSAAAASLDAGGDEWGTDEWGSMEWGAGQQFHFAEVPLFGECEYLKFAVRTTINGAAFGLGPTRVYTSQGRMA